MSYFFSERITYCEALLPSEIAWDVFNQLGEDQVVALQSTTINYDNPFVKSYRRNEETLAKITMIRSMLEQYSIWMDCSLTEVKDETVVWREFKNRIAQSKMEGYLYINPIEEEVFDTHHYLSGQLHEMQSLNKRVTQLILQMGLLVTMSKQKQFAPLYEREGQGGINLSIEMGHLEGLGRGNMFESKCVCLSRKDLIMLKKSLFRMTRGNSWVYELEIRADELETYFTTPKHRILAAEILTNKIVCMVIYPKGQRGMLLSKINRFFGCLDCHVLVAQVSNIREQLSNMQRKIVEIQAMEELTLDGIRKYVTRLIEVRHGSTISWLCYMEMYARKERQIYRALSSTYVSKNLVRFNLYIPSAALPLNIQPKANLPPLILNVKETDKMLPSKFDTNCMLEVPQQIVNTYGVPSHEEINPAPFYIVTFAFFIGVMFGDVGHMLMAIPLLIYFKANLWFWMIIIFMGYCGLIYNEFFGITLGLFTSCYTITNDGSSYNQQNDCVYSIGIDSIWKVSTNEMAFTNSLKMKAAVILGVVHMVFGLCLRLLNNLRQKKYSDILTTTLPQLVFMGCTFVYMDYLIIYKWNRYYPDATTAPSIISTMIAIYVNMAKFNSKDLLFWADQRSSQTVILALAAICVPIMLLAKTILIYCQRRGQERRQSHIQLQDEKMDHMAEQIEMEEVLTDKQSHEQLSKDTIHRKGSHEEEESMQEIAVHNFIETIEFVLGSVSNTASYLRLWALSLAHAQLSAVIFELTVLKMLEGGYARIIGLFLVFPFFFLITFGVLICMDSLECFLHSLRLHWVEFQNKFYAGKGYLFEPFSFKSKK